MTDDLFVIETSGRTGWALAVDVQVTHSGDLDLVRPSGSRSIIKRDHWVQVAQRSDTAIRNMYEDGALAGLVEQEIEDGLLDEDGNVDLEASTIRYGDVVDDQGGESA